MSRNLALLLLGSLLVAAAPAVAVEDAPLTLRRFALIAGANDGGPDRVRLRYAGRDAEAMGDVLVQLGGVMADDLTLLLEPSREELVSALSELHARVQQAQAGARRVEALVYYSGHSDEQGLLLAGERFAYEELREKLKALPAKVRVAILDSCASGAMVRSKGGIRRPALLLDTSSDLQGHAYLTSASATESAQESDRIGGSFFTHYLVSALRGAADSSGDGRVTLSEAYQFAFHETLARTEKTRSGPQHPNYDIQLVGTGDLVMTDTRATTASLLLPLGLDGRFFVRDQQDQLVAELRTLGTRPIELGLEPGTYEVTVDRDGGVFLAHVVLESSQQTALLEADLFPVELEPTVARGPAPAVNAVEAVAEEPGPYHRVPFNLAVVPSISFNQTRAGEQGRIVNNVSVGLAMTRAAKVRGLQLSFGLSLATEDIHGLQVGGGFSLNQGTTTGLQLSGLGNGTLGAFRGGQVAMGANAVKGTMLGLQMALGANAAVNNATGLQVALGANLAAQEMTGAQGALGANMVAGKLVGLQAALGANVVAGDFLGIQAALGANATAHNVIGIQGALGANITGKDLRGLQGALGFNLTRGAVTGAQVGLINVSESVDGFQLGLINVARRVRGSQVGLINVSRELDGAPLGLLNIIGNGLLHADYWYDEIIGANLALKLGGKNFYTVWSAGMQPKRRRTRSQVSLGLGVHVPFGPLFGELEALGGTLRVVQVRDKGLILSDVDPYYLFGRARLLVGWQLTSRFGLFAGASWNLAVPHKRNRTEAKLPGWTRRRVAKGTTFFDWPGFVIGLRI